MKNNCFEPRRNVLNLLTQVFVFAFLLVFSYPLYASASHIYGFSLSTGERGVGFGGFYGTRIQKNILFLPAGQIGWVKVRFFDIMGEAETSLYDWQGNVHKTNEQNLLLVPVFGEIQYFPLAGQIANNFNPFIMVGSGPVLVLDTPEKKGFIERWKAVEPSLSIGAHAAVGVEFYISMGSILQISLGYDFLPMRGEVDGRANYNGVILSFNMERVRPN